MSKTESRRAIPRKFGVALAVVALLIGAVGSAYAMHADGVFQLDGNTDPAIHPANVTGDDWDQLDDGAGDPNNDDGALVSSFITDPLSQTVDQIYTGGSTKDDLDTTGWRHTAGSVPDKDNIEHAFAAMYNTCDDGADTGTDPDTCLYFGLDRFARNGDAQVGFWFFKNSMTPLANGTFASPHSIGDILVLSNFTNGGVVGTIQVYKWVGTGGDTNGTLDLLAAEGECATTNEDPLLHDSCGESNIAQIQSAWTYDAKSISGTNNPMPQGSFYEGGINLNTLGLAGTCIASFIAETRSSQSVDAVLKDFAYGEFNVCSANIQVGLDGTNRVGTPHTVTGHVNVVQAGVSTNAPDGTTINFTKVSGPGNLSASSCVTSGGTGSCTVTLTSSVTGVTVIHASSDVSVGNTTFHVETNGSSPNSDDLQKTWVDAKIGIAGTDTDGIGETHTFTVTVEKDTGTGSFVAASGVDVDVTLDNASGADYDILAGTTCDVVGSGDTFDHAGTDTNASGQCVVNFTSASAGTVTGSATASVSITGLANPIVVTTDDTGSTGDAVKTFLDGTLVWHKVDQDGAPLGGATFEVCRTQNLNTSTNPDSYDNITPVCVSVTDNSAPDANPADGEFLLEDLILGTYTVRETAAPAGYHIDNPNAVSAGSHTVLDTSLEIVTPFVNSRLFRLIVLTCDDVSDELVVSAVTLDGSGLDTIGAVPAGLVAKGVTEADLCGLGGASYGDLPADTYDPSVQIPK
ncbi:MAG TPA: prealbumin-like fold domain-containing protein [Candidatus Limnocylindrales bacterium]|nr:prealbumin-like fold domain-containing protein [Candidatus Limnocylindrales bacterium]